MCLAALGTVVQLADEGALVEVGGAKRWASSLLVPDLEVGDRVWVSALTILDRVSDDDPIPLGALTAQLLEALDETG